MISCKKPSTNIRVLSLIFAALLTPSAAIADGNSISVADASLEASFYSDASCMITIDKFVQSGKTAIDADVGDEGMRMLIHCDTEDGRRLTLLARGETLNVSERAELLGRDQVAEGDPGMIAWLTRSGANYTDDTAPRRHVIGGSVKLRKSPPSHTLGAATNAGKQSFASIIGVLEPIIKSDDQNIQQTTSAVQPAEGEIEALSIDSLDEPAIIKPAADSDESSENDT